MCGIVGYVGRQPVVPVLLEGLARVEYRGYDSAGIAVLSPRDELKVYRRRGKLGALTRALPRRLAGRVGIGHTRWATHGEPSDENAHPHVDAAGRVAIVHNGILENAAELRALLEAGGVDAHQRDRLRVPRAPRRRPPGAGRRRWRRPCATRSPTSRGRTAWR